MGTEMKQTLSELDAQLMLAEVMNDTPTPVVIAGKEYLIRALKIGTMNLIAEESVKIQKAQDKELLDMYRQFAQCIPAVIKCIAYAVLNDKNKIFKDYANRKYSEEYKILYEQIEWESDSSQWMDVLVQIMNKIDLRFFTIAANTLTMIRDSALKTRKKSTTERM